MKEEWNDQGGRYEQRTIYRIRFNVDQHSGSSQRRTLGNTQRMVHVGDAYTDNGQNKIQRKGE